MSNIKDKPLTKYEKVAIKMVEELKELNKLALTSKELGKRYEIDSSAAREILIGIKAAVSIMGLKSRTV